MNHKEFLEKYLGKNTNFGEPYGMQCVSLSKQYTKDVLGVTPKSYGGSAWKGFMNGSGTFDTNLWVKGDLKAGDVAQEGDILFSPPTAANPHGHVAVAQDNDEMIEQNGKTGNGKGQGGDAIRMIPFKKDICGYWRLKSYKPTGSPAGTYTPVDPHAFVASPALSPIEKAWSEASVKPGFKKYYGNYTDTSPMDGKSVRMLIDLFAFNSK